MRDILDYTEKYICDDFEPILVEYRRKKVMEVIEQFGPNTLLEIGCGMRPLFLDLNNIATTIIEPSSTFCQNAREKNTDGKANIIQDFFDDEFKTKYGEEYEMIICSSLLHEVEKPGDFISAIHQVCNEGTIVHINVPNANSFHRILAQETGLINDVHDASNRNHDFQQNTVFDLSTLVDLVEKKGFKVIDKGSYFVKPFTHHQMSEMLNGGILDERILDGLDRMVKYMPELGCEIYVNCCL